MKKRFFGSPADILRADLVLIHKLDSFLAAIDIMDDDLGDQAILDKGYSLQGFEYEGTAPKHVVFSVGLPIDYEEDVMNSLYYRLYNLNFLGTYNLGELSVPLELGKITVIPTAFKWGTYDGKLWLYVPDNGAEEYRLAFWMSEDYSQEEFNLFFTKIHDFRLIYKKEETP